MPRSRGWSSKSWEQWTNWGKRLSHQISTRENEQQ